MTDRLRATAAAAGLLTVTGAWVLAGLSTEGFDPVERSISQLHRDGAPTQGLLTTGLLAHAAGLLLAAPVARRRLDSRAVGALAAAAGVVTATAALFPLAADKGLPQDLPHMASAATGYVAVSLLPLLGARRLTGRARTASYAVGVVTATAMALTVPLHAVSGGLQRIGLTLGSAWLVTVTASAAVAERPAEPVVAAR